MRSDILVKTELVYLNMLSVLGGLCTNLEAVDCTKLLMVLFVDRLVVLREGVKKNEYRFYRYI